jgi:hypothetical protein
MVASALTGRCGCRHTVGVPRASRTQWWWLSLGLLALAPRILAAVVRPPWHDEYFTVWAAGLPWKELLAALRLDSGPPLPYLLVKLVALLGVPPLVAARALAVAAGTGAVLLTGRVAQRSFGTEAGWWAAVLLALHPLAVAWSGEGRAYALLLLAAAWAWERLERVARGEGGSVGLGCAVALACWIHGLGMLLAAVLAVIALTLSQPARRRALAAIAAGFACYLPWLPVAAHQPPAAIAWMATFWRSLSPWDRLVAPVRLLSPLARFAGFLDLPSPPIWVEVGAWVLLLVLLAAACRAAGPIRRPLIGLVLPAATLGGLATLGVPAFYPGRGEVLYLVPWVVLIGAGACRFRALRTLAAVVALGAAIVTANAIRQWADRPPSPEQRLAVALRQRLPAGGTVVIGGFWRLGLAYHLGDEISRYQLTNYPASAAAHPGWYDPAAERPAPGELDRLLDSVRSRGQPTAVVLTPGSATATDLRHLAAALGLRRDLDVPGAELLVPAPRPGGAPGQG